MVSPSPEQAKIVAACLRLAAQSGWPAVTPEAVAKSAKAPLTAIKKAYPTATAFVPVIASVIDAEAFAAATNSDSAHDLLFDLLMARFDLLQKHRRAILAMEKAARRDVRLARALACASVDSVYRLIDAAALTFPPRPALALGLLAIYGTAFAAWRKDDSRDMAKTMSALDRALRWAGKAAGILTPRS